MNLNTRREQRNTIMILLYQFFLFENKNIENIYDKEKITDETNFINNIYEGVINQRNEIDEMANNYLTDWTIDRLGKVDQSILRMAIYELIWTDTPPIVVIDEAIELAKLYSDDAVRKMINSVLDKIYHNKSR